MKPLEKAIAIAIDAHAGQTDKAGAPYVLHPLRIMLRMETDDEMMAAVLHDVVEDADDWTLDRLLVEGIPSDVVEAVKFLTKRPEEENDYPAFIARASRNPIARRVKLADLEDNMDLGRIAHPVEKDFVRVEKYRRAHAYLAGAGDPLSTPSASSEDASRRPVPIGAFQDGRVASTQEVAAKLNADALDGDRPPALPSGIQPDRSEPVQLDPVLVAAKKMVAAINGEGPKCEPITVCKRADGKYEVLDGHDTLQAARLAGWTKVAIQVVERN